MFRRYKYDIAISVAEENISIADQIKEALISRGIRCFLYTDQQADIFGEHILKVCLGAFGVDTRYVLMITSRIYAKQYWGNIERLIAEISQKSRKPRLLQVRLEPSKIDLIRQNRVYQDWKNNPEELADLIKYKLKKDKEKNKIWLITLVLVIVVMSTAVYIFIHRKGDPDISSENPIKVSVNKHRSFYINPTEVTIGQYRKYCFEKGKTMPSQLYTDSSYPVTNISWSEADAYCKWCNGRLPTESEWEYAAGVGLSRYSGGNNASMVAVYGTIKPSKVGMRLPNLFNLYDMSGNAAEWCSDWYMGDSTILRQKVIKGGAYNSSIKELEILYDDKEFLDSAKPYIGFRVAWDNNKSIHKP